jgi:hypothetical protein
VPEHAYEHREKPFEQTADPAGRIRLDRKLTPAEAAAQERYLEERQRRFAPHGDDATA